MKWGWLRYLATMSAASVALVASPPPVGAEGNAGLHVHKTVDPLQVGITPNIGVTLSVDRSSAIPADVLTYTAVVTNPTATFSMGGEINAEAVASSDATVAYYWDELEVCALGCGNGMGNGHWTAVATFEATQPGYVPVTPPALHTGMTFAAKSIVRSGVTYPSSGDAILGTLISSSATAAWMYRATVNLTPSQITTLGNPAQAQAMRNVLHVEVTVRNVAAAQPYTDPEPFSNPFTSAPNPGAVSNVTVTFTLPDGTTTKVPATSTLSPGAIANATAHYKVPVPGLRGQNETEPAYVSRLAALDGSVLTASAIAAGGGFSGPVYATSSPVTTIENLPIVTIAKSGPSSVNAGDTETNPLALTNQGGAPASSIAITDTVPGGASGTVTGTPATLAPGGKAASVATYAVPISQAEGGLTDTASVTWKDANGNAYGPLSSAFTTHVHNLLFGAQLTLAPASAGPNLPGTTQTLTATLLDRLGNPIAGQVVTFTVTGANPTSGTGTTDANGKATFTYTGTNSGNDVARATVTAPGLQISSNTALITWGKMLQTLSTGAINGNFFANPTNSCTFDVGPAGTPVFNQSFPDILFNARASSVPHDISSVDNFTRPFTDLTVDVNGNYNGQIVAQGNGQQAGTGSLTNFYAEFTGTFVVNQPGDVTLSIQHDDGYLLGVGNGATRVNGDFEGNPPATTPFNEYPVVAAFNQSVVGSTSAGAATVHFPAAGTYPYELDYTECGAGGLFLVLQTAQFAAQTNPLSVYVGYADGLRPAGSIFPFPWNGSPNVLFVGFGGRDNGAIRFDNSGSAPIAFDQVTVDIGPFHYDIWPKNISLPPGQILIYTGFGGDNFDTSDTPITCTPTGYIPQIHVTSGGVTTTFKDTGQILNTGGIDTAVCLGVNESHAWTRIGGGGAAINTPLPPAASLDIMPFNVGNALTGQNLALTVLAMDGAGNALPNLPVTLQVFGPNAQTMSATTQANGLAVFNYVGTATGTDRTQATAFFGGLRLVSNLGTVVWSVPVGGSANPPPNPNPNAPPAPTITSTLPADGSVVTKPVNVTASVAPPSGETIVGWRVFYQALDPGTPVVIASGTGTPPATLGTFDPTVLPNDAYGITVEATASGGGTQDVTSTVTVLGNLKPGRFTATYQDLSVPVAGFSMEVRRTYDSFDKSQGDFGVGWKVSVVNFRIAANHVLGAGGWTMYDKQCSFGLCFTAYKNSAPRFMTVVFPDQHTEDFDLTPDGGTNIFWSCTPVFTAEGVIGSTSTLVPLDDTSCSYTGDGNLYGSSGVYNPQRFKLTTRDGQVFVLDRRLGLISQTDTHGNALNIDSSGVHSTSGGSITFTRDPSGRITKIVGPAGETLTYAYSSSGDLASVTQANGALTTFAYDANHNLTSTSGPNGQPLVTSTYDSSGRLTSITDATGKTVQVASNVAGQQEVVTDAAGEVFIDTLSDRGDLLSQAEIADGRTNTYTFTYDSLGRQLSATDPLGNTSTWTYDNSGDLLSSTDPHGRKSTMTYGPSGELLTFTDPAGGVTTYRWDSALNLVSFTDAGGATTAYTYDAAGNRTSERNALGAVSSYTYDGSGRVLTQTDPLGRVTTKTYDASGRLLSVTDPAGNRTVYAYDAAGLLTSSTDPTGAVTKYVHDALGRPTSVTDPLGRTTTYVYDGNGNILSRTDALGGKTTYTYDADGRELTETDPTGAVLTYAYDGHGRAIALMDAVGRVTHRVHDEAGNLISETNPAGGTTTYSYGADGLKTGSTDPLGRTTVFTYDIHGLLASQTDPMGHKTLYAYDAMGRTASTTDPLGGVTRYTYDAAGQRTSETDPTGGVTTYAFDLAGQQTSRTDPTGRTTTFTYDAAGNLATMSDAAGHTTTYHYDADGRRTQVITPLGRATTSAYDRAGELTSVTDPLGNSTVYAYDANGRQISATSPRGLTSHTTYDGAGRPLILADPLGDTVRFAYDAAGERTSITDPAGHVTTFAYAPLGGLASRTFPWGGTQSYSYDAAGQMASATNARGNTATFTYDAAGRLVGRSVAGGNFSQAYDAAGRRTGLTDATGTTTFTFDAAGRVASVAAPAGSVGYTYDAAGRRASVTLASSRTVTYAYDTAGLSASATDWTGAATTFTHNADGQVTSMSRPGSTAAYTYDAAGRIASIAFGNGTSAIDTFTYTYDADSNRISVTSNAGAESYTIDGARRLTSAHYADGSTTSYTYDAAGNRLSSAAAGATTSYSYDAAGRLVSVGSTALTYDADGNVLSSGADTFAYDWAGRLTSAGVGGIANTYTYNADGVRVAGSHGPASTSYVVDLAVDLPQVLGDGTNTYVRDPGGSLLEWRSATGSAMTPLEDALGSVRYQADASGTIKGTASYGAFGDVRSQTGAVSPFGFTGQQADPTGLLYLRARYYDPAFGRFLSPDSIDSSGPGAAGFNRYVYAMDDPTTFTDPSGHQVAIQRAIIWSLVVLEVYVIWQIGQAIIALLKGTCLYGGHCYSAPAVTSSGTIARPLTRPAGKTLDKQALKALVKGAVMACAAAGTYGALAGGGANNPCNVLPIDVFYIGPDLWEVTGHDLGAIKDHPFVWETLVKADHPLTTTNRKWYLTYDQCSPDKYTANPTYECDEYPYFSTEEGGPAGGANLGADLKMLDGWQNGTQGARLGGFYRRCRIPNGDIYIVAPGPVLTYGVCKFWGK